MTSGSQPNRMVGKLPGKSLTRGTDGKWQQKPFDEIAKELRNDINAPRILSVESTKDRIKRLNLSKEDEKKEKESFEVFSLDANCTEFMSKTYKFPAYLFYDSWSKSNGFAGSMRLPNGNISWFRVLVKMIKGMDGYYWHEMTFFIRQLNGPDESVTVLCFEVPDDPVNDNTDPSIVQNDNEESDVKHCNFLEGLCFELSSLPTGSDPDWRCMQSILLRQAIVVVDRGVWACSKIVRDLEKGRPDPKMGLNTSFDFPRAHDLLRHALHSTEILKVAYQTLNDWLEQYHADQKRQQRQQQHQLQLSQQGYDDDTTLPSETYYQDLASTLQLLSNLSHRSASNDARLRNEINLAFNVVNQQDIKAMRIISIVTLTFLPATFVSTLFSMTFFRQPSDQQPWGVSPKLWIYFVVSVPLTAVTIALWVWGARVLRWWSGPDMEKKA